MTRRLLAVTTALVLAATLGGCGKVGQLERPGPLFGVKAGSAQQTMPQQDPTRPVQTFDPRDRPDLDPVPPPPAPPAPDPAGAAAATPK